MKRRTFFKTTALSSSALALLGISACTSLTKNEVEIDITEFEFNEITVDELQQKMETREQTSVDICQKYLARIEMVDPVLKSVIELNPEALEIAQKLDDERKSGKVRGALHGIPILIKDNIININKFYPIKLLRIINPPIRRA